MTSPEGHHKDQGPARTVVRAGPLYFRAPNLEVGFPVRGAGGAGDGKDAGLCGGRATPSTSGPGNSACVAAVGGGSEGIPLLYGITGSDFMPAARRTEVTYNELESSPG